MRVFDKPSGVTTHTSLNGDEQRRSWVDPIDGFLEHLEYRSAIKLWPVHRLDVGTSGVCIAAESAAEAGILSANFESRDIEKTYYFITDRQARRGFETGGRIESHVTRLKSGGGAGTQYASFAPTSIEPINAVTTLEFVRRDHGFSLWRARPETGRPHQIRLHAESAGLSVLGDSEHGGTRFPTLCLHATGLKGENLFAESKPPVWFERLELLDRPQLIQWLQARDRRERLFRSLQTVGVSTPDTVRWIHSDGQSLRWDQLGPIHHLQWLRWQGASEQDKSDLAVLIDLMKMESWYFQIRGNRGQSPNAEEIRLSRPDLPLEWIGSEEGLRFIFKRSSGLSPGLFLDQRASRRYLRCLRPKSVLNLFAYTGGFSIAAAASGAETVVTVDISRNFLDWTKENFKLNGLDPDRAGFEFREINAQSYLKWAAKNGLSFDFVVCDPPSFARLEKSVFRLENELEPLLLQCMAVTASGGRILFSTNHEGLLVERLHKQIDQIIKASRLPFRIERASSPDWDFEFPREVRATKSILLQRR